ncbi:family 16 glycoside hydrolase [Allorhizocola rhizosphaerae]|uniref:pectate lyase family protein n=1 Tax=Allorhizocola rhizosphaerae TaxID=1872709 RepID=UPI000E3BEB84|nr:family 16 glycoside hydrolase [Allorhizocola rhizosphaerae]
MNRKALIAAAAAVVTAVGLFVGTANAATLIEDNFNDGNASGWTTSGGSWSVAAGAYEQTGTGSDAKALAGSTSWTNYSVQARVRPNAFGSNSARAVGVSARAQSLSNFYSFVLTPSGAQLRRGTTVLASASLSVSAGTWYTLSLNVSGPSLSGSVNGTQVVSTSDSTYANGRAGFHSSYGSASFDDIVVFTGTAPSPTATSSPTPTGSPIPEPPAGQPDGFAIGTTGGAGGPTVTVTNAAQLADYAGRAGPYNIMVSGTISTSDMITVVANKSIIGVGSTAHITGGGLQMGSTTRPGHNVIIRNIKFSNASDDSISVTNGARGVWIDHNEFLPGSDGSLDIKRQSTNVTVSWNVFHGTDKSMLLGHSDTATVDVGYLKVTYHHNYFNGSNQRHPRARFGDPVHVYNNYYRNIGLYGIASTQNAGVLVEGNYFENAQTQSCWSATPYGDSDIPGRLVQRNNIFVNSGPCEVNGSVAPIPYGYTLTPTSSVPSVVTSGAGVGKI